MGLPLPRCSLGVGSVLGQGDLRGHQEEDVSLEVDHGFLLGLLGCVFSPGRSVDVKGGVGTSGPLGDGESADQLEEVLTAGIEPALDPLPNAIGRESAPQPPERCGRAPHGADVPTLLCRPQPPHSFGNRVGPAPYVLRDSLLVLVDGWHVNAGENVAIHVVGASDVVDVGGVSKQVDGVIGDEVSINDRDVAQIVQHGIYVEEPGVLAPSVPTCVPPPPPRWKAPTSFHRDQGPQPVTTGTGAGHRCVVEAPLAP